MPIKNLSEAAGTCKTVGTQYRENFFSKKNSVFFPKEKAIVAKKHRMILFNPCRRASALDSVSYLPPHLWSENPPNTKFPTFTKVTVAPYE